MAAAQGSPFYVCPRRNGLAQALQLAFEHTERLRFAKRNGGPPMRLRERSGSLGRFWWRSGSGVAFERWIPLADVVPLEARA